MTYQEAIDYLNSFINYERQDSYCYEESFRLDRMRVLARLLGDPQKGIKSIHIAGTKGKGSTCAITHSILKSAHLKVGLYTSPHLVSFRERIRIGDDLISGEDIGRLLGKVRRAVGDLKDDAPSFFEVCTALAYLYFKEKRVDFAVYEVGLGGRLDATNIIEPLVCAITPISYEHTQKLGNTLRQIAAEKAGIIKPGGICVLAPQEKEALETIEGIAGERDARLFRVGKDILFEEMACDGAREVFNVSTASGKYPALEMRLLGSHQVANAATAIGIIDALRLHGITIPADAVRTGILNVRWEGRLEVVSRSPLIVLDGAQNRASAEALAKAVKNKFAYKKLILVLGVSKDKDIVGILEELLPIADSIILTKSKAAMRSLDPGKIEEMIKAKGRNALLTSSVEEAVVEARRRCGADDLALITGSLFVVGEAREILVGDRT